MPFGNIEISQCPLSGGPGPTTTTPERPMNENEKVKLKEHMTTSLVELESTIASLKELTKPIAPDDSIGRLTRMEAINSKSINEAALRNAKQKKARIETALKEIDDPDFGLCLACEEPIPMKRLMLLPEATHCVKCAG